MRKKSAPRGVRLEYTTARVIVVLVVIINALALVPELSISRFDLNDSVFHYTMADRMVQAIDRGENPLDFWVSESTFGYPVSRTYQPLGHLLLAVLYKALAGTVPLMTVFVWIRYLLVVFLPVTVYLTSRQLGLPPIAAVASALISPLLSTNGLYGLEYRSYLWRGSGLFTQALAMHFLFFAVGFTAKSMRNEGKGIAAGLLLGLTFLSHFIYGYIGAFTACLIAAIPNVLPWPGRFLRLATVGAMSLCVAMFELVPLFLDSAFVNHSRWEPAWKWDSFGGAQVLRQLFSGNLMDFGRLPVLSVLVLLGGVVCIVRVRRNAPKVTEELPANSAALLICGSVLWVLLYFGRPAWGKFFAVFAPPDLQLHRLIGGVHLFFILIAGVGLAAIWRLILSGNRRFAYPLLIGVTLALLLPAVRERSRFLGDNEQWGKENQAAFEKEHSEIDAVVSTLQRVPGRVYPGLSSGWGKDFRVGAVPFYGVLSTHHIPAVASLSHAMALTSDIMMLFNEGNPDSYELFNVSTVVSDGLPMPGFIRETQVIGRFHIAEGPPAGYFDVVRVPYAVHSSKQTFYDISANWLHSDWPHQHTHILMDFSKSESPGFSYLPVAGPRPPLSQEPSPGKVVSEHKTNEQYGALIHMSDSGYVLFKMTYHPEWKAMVDGSETPIVMLTPGFIGIAVAPGDHRIEMIYSPGVMKWVLLFAGTAAAAIMTVIARKA